MSRSAQESRQWIEEARDRDRDDAGVGVGPQLRLVDRTHAVARASARAVSPWWIWGVILLAEAILALLSA